LSLQVRGTVWRLITILPKDWQPRGEVCQVVIHHRVAFQHCLIDGRTAAEFEPEGAAALEIEALYADVLSCLNAGMSAC
jgi:hypothetical protein